jgi:hypothetical protein
MVEEEAEAAHEIRGSFPELKIRSNRRAEGIELTRFSHLLYNGPAMTAHGSLDPINKPF